jgi:hypothetical protein
VSAVKTGLLCLVLAACAGAHIGSPDVFFQGNAGPYRMLVVIRPPNAIPGTAAIEVRSLDPGVTRIELTPTPMTGPGAKHPPVADVAEQSKADPQYFTGTLWLMSSGSWEVHVRAFGAAGSGELPVPISATATKTAPMQPGVEIFLTGMLLFLGAGLVAIVGAAVRESKLDPGAPTPRWSRGSLGWMSFTAALLGFAVWAGKAWWADDAATNAKKIFKPLEISASLENGSRLTLQLKDPGWLVVRRLDNIVADHGHLMHLFLVRWPDMSDFFHLHPDQNATGFFSLALPSLPAGRYRLYGDIVHDSGFAETAVGDIDLPNVTGVPLDGDDAGGYMPGDPRVVWLRDNSKPIRAKEVNLFRFAVNGPNGPEDLEPYMGMAGHAEFVKLDGAVFAHVHPTGTVPMAAAAIASPEAMMAMHSMPIGKTAEFPYGLPEPGRYRVFVQLRHGAVRTAAFDLTVAP